jgi:hypothetical protein
LWIQIRNHKEIQMHYKPSYKWTAGICMLSLFVILTFLPGQLIAKAASSPALRASAAPTNITFRLKPNPPFVNCMAAHPGDPSRPPTAIVTVHRAALADILTLRLSNFRPGLAFDLFTVQNTNLKPNGSVDTAFKGFGLSWYQSDVEADANGNGTASIKTILLDQIFGFDPALHLGPTNTFEIGFWFNNPADAAACGFKGFTPFNGEHRAGPNAMISVANSTTDLGPLCTQPNTTTSPATCNP